MRDNFVRRKHTNTVISLTSSSKMKMKPRMHPSGSISRDMNTGCVCWITRVVLYIALSRENIREKLMFSNIYTFSWKVPFIWGWYHALKFYYRVPRDNHCIISFWYRTWRDNYLVSRDAYIVSRDKFHEIKIMLHLQVADILFRILAIQWKLLST